MHRARAFYLISFVYDKRCGMGTLPDRGQIFVRGNLLATNTSLLYMSSHSFVDQNREDKYQFMSEHCQLSVIQFVNDVILKIKTQVHDIYKQQKIKK